MRLAEFSVKNSLLVNLVSVFIIVVGIMAMYKIPLDMFPSVDFDIVTVSTSYPGAPAEDVEKFVTIPIEKELKGISGIKEIQSSSDEGSSKIGITLILRYPIKVRWSMISAMLLIVYGIYRKVYKKTPMLLN